MVIVYFSNYKWSIVYNYNILNLYLFILDREKNKKTSNKNIPDKYFVVKNNDYVRVRYLLVYADRKLAR